MKLAKLLHGSRGRRAHHEILSALIHGKRDDLADVVLAGEQHHHSVNSWCNSAMRRCTIFERRYHAAELLVHGLRRIASDAKRLVHDLRIVVPDRATRQLIPVAHDVILVCEDIQRILSLKSLHAALRHRERIVRELDLACLFVEFIEREIDDPAEAIHPLFDQVQIAAQLAPQLTGYARGIRLGRAYEEHNVTGSHTTGLSEACEVIIRQEFGDRALHLLIGPHEVRKTLRPN